jgi:hypothetical protein
MLWFFSFLARLWQLPMSHLGIGCLSSRAWPQLSWFQPHGVLGTAPIEKQQLQPSACWPCWC